MQPVLDILKEKVTQIKYEEMSNDIRKVLQTQECKICFKQIKSSDTNDSETEESVI